jgi:hypothetical protein
MQHNHWKSFHFLLTLRQQVLTSRQKILARLKRSLPKPLALAPQGGRLLFIREERPSERDCPVKRSQTNEFLACVSCVCAFCRSLGFRQHHLRSRLLLEVVKALDTEVLIKQTDREVINFGQSWKSAPARRKREIQSALFPEGFSVRTKTFWFCTANPSLVQSFRNMLDDLFSVGVPGGI